MGSVKQPPQERAGLLPLQCTQGLGCPCALLWERQCCCRLSSRPASQLNKQRQIKTAGGRWSHCDRCGVFAPSCLFLRLFFLFYCKQTDVACPFHLVYDPARTPAEKLVPAVCLNAHSDATKPAPQHPACKDSWALLHTFAPGEAEWVMHRVTLATSTLMCCWCLQSHACTYSYAVVTGKAAT